MLIKHYTKPHWVSSILQQGQIALEDSQSADTQHTVIDSYWGPGHSHIDPLGRALTQSWLQVRPRYVWLTEDTVARTAYTGPGAEDCYFAFDSDSIQAQKWHYAKRTIAHPQAPDVVALMDRGARMIGDDPYHYWVCTQPVSVALAVPGMGVLEDPSSFTDPQKFFTKYQDVL